MSSVDNYGVVSVPRAATRYVAVGTLSAGLDLGLLVVAREGLALPVAVAAGVAYAGSALANYTLSARYTFRVGHRLASRQMARYVTLLAANLVVTAASVALIAAAGAHYLMGKMAVLAMLTVVNFFMYRNWVFQAGHESS